jgi:stringent starvation protein B
MNMDLPSTKPYLIRAIHQWCCDNGFTPYLAVVVDERTRVPREHVRDGQIVLNVGYDATAHLSLDNDGISFQARFGGVARDLSIPIGNVSAIYARENGAGMAFEPESATASTEHSEPPTDEPPEPPPPAGRARLQRVK